MIFVVRYDEINTMTNKAIRDNLETNIEADTAFEALNTFDNNFPLTGNIFFQAVFVIRASRNPQNKPKIPREDRHRLSQ